MISTSDKHQGAVKYHINVYGSLISTTRESGLSYNHAETVSEKVGFVCSGDMVPTSENNTVVVQ